MLNNPELKTRDSSENGYIALISAIIISATLMAVVFNLSFAGFMTRYNLLDSEYKERSYELAFACLDIARLKLTAYSGYAGDETITVGTSTCKIISVASGTVKTKATINSATTNLEAVLNTADFSIISLTEK